MHIWYILSFMGTDELQRLAEVLAVDALAARKTDAAMMLSDRLQSAEGFQRAYATLSQADRRWLQVFLFSMESDGYVLFLQKQQIYSWCHDRPELRQEAEQTLAKLQGLGFFGKSHNWYAGESMECADELLPYLYQTIYLEMFAGHAAMIDEFQPIVEFGNAFTRDVARFLSLLAKRQVGFTKNNILYKRETSKIQPYFRTAKSGNLQGTGAWEGIPGAIVIAIKHLVNMKIIKLDDGKTTLQGQHLEEWLQKDQDSLYETVFELTLQVLRETPSHLYGVLAEWLQHGAPGEWVALLRVFDHLLALLPVSVVSAWEQKLHVFISITTLTGVLDHTESRGHGLVARIAKWQPESPKRFVAQPNLDVLVPEEAPLLLHFFAGQLGDLLKADVMSTYHLNKERILQLCDRGWSFEDVERALSTLSNSPVQPSVLKTVRDWMATYNRAVFWDALLIRFQLPEWLQEFVHDKRAGGIVVDVLGDVAVIIKRSGEKAAREILDDIGAPAPLAVRKPVAEGTALGTLGTKVSKTNAEAFNRLTSAKVIETIGMKLPSFAKSNT